MTINKNWRPEDWDEMKKNLLNSIPMSFSPSTGYSKDDKDKIVEATATMLLSALAAVLVTGPE